MTASRIDLQLGVIGATHKAESVILFLTGVTRSLSGLSRDAIDRDLSDAETMAWDLFRSIQRMKDENWNALCASVDHAPVRKEGEIA